MSKQGNSKDLQIRKLPESLALLLARPDFGSYLAAAGSLDAGTAMKLDIESVTQRAAFLLFTGFGIASTAQSITWDCLPLVVDSHNLSVQPPATIQIRVLPEAIKQFLEEESLAMVMPSFSALDPWTQHTLCSASPSGRAVYLIYLGLNAISGHSTLRTPPGAHREYTAIPAATAFEIYEGDGSKSLLPDESPIWQYFS